MSIDTDSAPARVHRGVGDAGLAVAVMSGVTLLAALFVLLRGMPMLS